MVYTRKEEGEYKMRKKFRIFSTLTAMVLVVIVMCVGIWAASQATITGSDGSLTVNHSSNVFATVTVNFGDAFGADNPQNVQTFEFDATTTDSDSKTISLPHYVFESGKSSVSFVVTVKNDSTNGSSNLAANLSVNLGGTNHTLFEVSITESNSLELQSGKSGTFTVTINYVGNYSNNDAATYDFNLTLDESAD